MGRRYDTFNDLKRRRRAWAVEIGTGSQWSDFAPQIVRQLDDEIATSFEPEPIIPLTASEQEIVNKLSSSLTPDLSQ